MHLHPDDSDKTSYQCRQRYTDKVYYPDNPLDDASHGLLQYLARFGCRPLCCFMQSSLGKIVRKT